MSTSTFNSSLYVVKFNKPSPKAPANILAEGSLVFKGGLLEGFALTGFTVWGNANKPPSISLPSRSYVGGGIKKNWELLRAVSDDDETVQSLTVQLKSHLLLAFHTWQDSQPPSTATAPTMPTSQQAFAAAMQGVADAAGVKQGVTAQPKPNPEDL